mgnify:CR=1 FL=1
MNDMTEQEEQPLLLLVDDDPTFTRVMARALSRRGLRVNTAGDADEAMQLARQEQPDYAVLDLKMEGDSGLVLLPRLLELYDRLLEHHHGSRSHQAWRLQLPVQAC